MDLGNLIVLDSVFESTDDNFEKKNLDWSNQVRKITGNRRRKSALKLGVFLFEHGSGSDPDLIPVRGPRLQEWISQSERSNIENLRKIDLGMCDRKQFRLNSRGHHS